MRRVIFFGQRDAIFSRYVRGLFVVCPRRIRQKCSLKSIYFFFSVFLLKHSDSIPQKIYFGLVFSYQGISKLTNQSGLIADASCLNCFRASSVDITGGAIRCSVDPLKKVFLAKDSIVSFWTPRGFSIST